MSEETKMTHNSVRRVERTALKETLTSRRARDQFDLSEDVGKTCWICPRVNGLTR